MSYTKGYRYSRVPGVDNSQILMSRQFQNPAYAATIALANLDCERNCIDFKQLTGTLTVTAEVVNPFAGDKLEMDFSADGSSRVVTLSTGFISAGTITVAANKVANVIFKFSSALQLWVEQSRFVQS